MCGLLKLLRLISFRLKEKAASNLQVSGMVFFSKELKDDLYITGGGYGFV